MQSTPCGRVLPCLRPARRAGAGLLLAALLWAAGCKLRLAPAHHPTPPPPPHAITDGIVDFAVNQGATTPQTSTLRIENTGGGTAHWTLKRHDAPPYTAAWFTAPAYNPAGLTGSTAATPTLLPITVDPTGLSAGVYVNYFALTCQEDGAFSVASVRLTIEPPTAPLPQITGSGADALVGQTLSWTVTAAGTLPQSFQWQRNGSDIPGATQPTFTLTATLADDGATYRVVVGNIHGTTATPGITLAVHLLPTLPVILSQPKDVWVQVGDAAAFVCQTDGVFPYTRQWQRNGSNLPGANGDRYSIPAVTGLDDGAQFRLVCANAGGTLVSATATLHVVTHPLAPTLKTWSPAQLDRLVGMPLYLYCSYTAGDTPLIQWQRNGVDIPGANSATYTSPPLSLTDSGAQYRVVISNPYGVAVSPLMTVTVSAPALVATCAPPAATVATGGSVQFLADFTPGYSPLTWQWQRNGVDLPGENGAKLTLTNLTAVDDGAQYTVRISSPAGPATSAPAVLTVRSDQAPGIVIPPCSQTIVAGDAVGFQVVAAGSAPLSYQWQRNGVDLPGETVACLTLATVVAGDNGAQFRVRVTNAAGTAVSPPASLAVVAGTRPTLVGSLTVVSRKSDPNPVNAESLAFAGLPHWPVKRSTAPWLSLDDPYTASGPVTLQTHSASPGAWEDYGFLTLSFGDRDIVRLILGNEAYSYSASGMFRGMMYLPTGPVEPRVQPSLVTTGAQILVWGGRHGAWSHSDDLPQNTGGLFDLTLQNWTGSTSLVGAPTARFDHVAVWTGSRMLVWGGSDGQRYLNDGGSYDPVTNSWSPLTAVNAPPPRRSAAAAWTGSRLFVWGGQDSAGARNDGGLYDPATDSWTPLATPGAPAPAAWAAAEWTGSAVVVVNAEVPYPAPLQLDAYDPAGNRWLSAVPAGFNDVSPNNRPWLSLQNGALYLVCNNGEQFRYHPAIDLPLGTYHARQYFDTGNPELAAIDVTLRVIDDDEPLLTAPPKTTWVLPGASAQFQVIATSAQPLSYQWQLNGVDLAGKTAGTLTIPGVLLSQEGEQYTVQVTAGGITVTSPPATLHVETGGFTRSPATLSFTVKEGAADPAAQPVSVQNLAPHAVADAVVRCTADQPWVTLSSPQLLNPNPGAVNVGVSTHLSAAWTGQVSATLAKLLGHTVVFDGNDFLLWGGYGSFPDQGGGRYSLFGARTGTISAVGAPTDRRYHSAVWTGTRMLVWGGKTGTGNYTSDNAVDPGLNTGAAYNPATDTWTPLSATGAPAARHSHAAVWTGNRLLIWGGRSNTTAFNDGAAYDPATDSWAPIATANAPSARFGSAAVWTGQQMLVWAGESGGLYTNDGALYDPATDTWSPMTTLNAPAGREYPAACFDGATLQIFGGVGVVDTQLERYDPTLNQWLPPVALPAAIPQAGGAQAVSTGVTTLLFGGDPYLNFRYVPAQRLPAGTYTATLTLALSSPASTQTTAITLTVTSAFRVGAVNPVPGSSVPAPIQIDVIFTAEPDPAQVDLTHFTLRRSGGDGAFADGNEIAIAPNGVSLTAPQQASLDLSGVSLPPDVYELTVKGTLHDTAGNRLDGEFNSPAPSGDGHPGGDYVMTFTVN